MKLGGQALGKSCETCSLCDVDTVNCRITDHCGHAEGQLRASIQKFRLKQIEVPDALHNTMFVDLRYRTLRPAILLQRTPDEVLCQALVQLRKDSACLTCHQSSLVYFAIAVQTLCR